MEAESIQRRARPHPHGPAPAPPGNTRLRPGVTGCYRPSPRTAEYLRLKRTEIYSRQSRHWPASWLVFLS
ncbi:hypothetical protein GCM10010306_082660 [Streptomyces umbrinus]|nr:hypothetical protein GCM10010306_082660 [Streptomyces umbrinus]